MHNRVTVLLVLSTSLILPTTTLLAREKDLSSAILTEFDGPHTPDYMLLAPSLKMLASLDRDVGLQVLFWELNHVPDPDAPEAQRLPPSGEERFNERSVRKTYAKLMALLDDMRAQEREARELLCPSSTSRPVGEAAFAAFDAFDARVDAVRLNCFREIYRQFEPQLAERLVEWITSGKEGYRAVSYDTRKLYELTGTDVDTHLASVCSKFEEEDRR